MNGELWPADIFDACVEVFGKSVFNLDGRTRKTLDKAVNFAYSRWRDRYEMNYEQDKYATEVIVWAVRQSAQADRRVPYFVAVIQRVVNDERVHQGFVRRATPLVDVTAILKEAESCLT